MFWSGLIFSKTNHKTFYSRSTEAEVKESLAPAPLERETMEVPKKEKRNEQSIGMNKESSYNRRNETVSRLGCSSSPGRKQMAENSNSFPFVKSKREGT